MLNNFKWPYLRNGSRSTYIARIALSSLRQHSFLVPIHNHDVYILIILPCQEIAGNETDSAFAAFN